MEIKNIKLKNFRLLDDISINLENDVTLIVGKNNTGKTSLFEAIHIATSLEGKFIFEDFSLNSYPIFISTYELYLKSLNNDIDDNEKDIIENQIISCIPKIQIYFEISYNKDTDSLNELNEFITDLDDARNDVTICISFEPFNSIQLYKYFNNRDDNNVQLIPFLKNSLSTFYKTRCYAIDKESDYKREIEDSFRLKIRKVVVFESIKAMRILDDTYDDSKRTLAKGFSNYYKQRDKDNQAVQELEKALKSISEDLKERYEIILAKIINQLGLFGANTPINIPEITIDSQFDSEKVMNNNIHYYYKQGDINLPENYNGLGYSNLIYMILELAGFIEKFKNNKEENFSNILVVLIEEPEAHMHPQMQQVFISEITKLTKEAKNNHGICIQLVITTHSSHILSESGIDIDKGFNRIRYFNRLITKNENMSLVKIKVQDFNNLKIRNEKNTFRFLKQYLTLHKSDLFFADKVIMVEGTTERLLIPLMIKKTVPKLCNEYVTILEIGGAYAHIFKEILEFIEIKTLIVTDIDSAHTIEKDGKPSIEKCLVKEGEFTTNETLSKWLPKKKAIVDLVNCTLEQKIDKKIRVAYQTNENGYNARSFEDAFINCNKSFLQEKYIDKNGNKRIKKDEFSLLVKNDLVDIPTPCDSKIKTNFTFDILCFNEIELGEWGVPNYIKEGLIWLAEE